MWHIIDRDRDIRRQAEQPVLTRSSSERPGISSSPQISQNLQSHPIYVEYATPVCPVIFAAPTLPTEATFVEPIEILSVESELADISAVPVEPEPTETVVHLSEFESPLSIIDQISSFMNSELIVASSVESDTVMLFQMVPDVFADILSLALPWSKRGRFESKRRRMMGICYGPGPDSVLF